VELLRIAELFGAGLLLGALGGLLGIGGGLFAIPLLALWFGLDQQHAQGTSLVMVVPNVLVGLWNYARRGNLDRRLSFALAGAALPVTYLGARLAVHVPSAPLRVAFAIFLLAIAALSSYRGLVPRRADAPARAPFPWPFAFGVGGLGGALSGLFGVGGAVFAVPLMSYLFGLSQAAAQGMGLALVAPGTLVGIATYAAAGDVDWTMGIPLAVGGVLSVPSGVKLAYKLPERTLRLAFSALIVVAAVALIVRAG
jgi:hypothetical protein